MCQSASVRTPDLIIDNTDWVELSQFDKVSHLYLHVLNTYCAGSLCLDLYLWGSLLPHKAGRWKIVVPTLPFVPHPPQWVLTKASEIIFPLVSFMNNLKLWANSICFQIMDTKQFPKKERKKKEKLHDIQTIHTTDYCLPKIPDAPLMAETV